VYIPIKKWVIIWCGKCHTMPHGGSAPEDLSNYRLRFYYLPHRLGKMDKPLQSKLNYIEKNVASGIRESGTQ